MDMGRSRLGRNKTCAHASTIEVTTSGLTRVVCEDCGLVAITAVSPISSEVDRSRFERRSDRPAKHSDLPTPGPT